MSKHARCKSKPCSPPIDMARALLGIGVIFMLSGCGEQPPALAPRAQVHELEGADPGRGRQLIADYGCVACHIVPGVRGPSSNVGPSLENIALRAYLGGVLPTTAGNLVRWLMDPPAVDPRTAMPDMGLTEGKARDIAAYLLTLH